MPIDLGQFQERRRTNETRIVILVRRNWIDQAHVKKMAPVEQEMFANLKVMYQTGKGNDHFVPVLVPTDVAPALCLLAR